MIGHQAKCMHNVTVALDSFLQKKVKAIPVIVGKEDVLPAVPSEYHMIKCTRIMNSRFSCH